MKKALVDNSKKVVLLGKQPEMKQKEIRIRYFELEGLDGLSEDEVSLVEEAREASLSAWAPYSGFHVGAAVGLENGQVVVGNNQENAAYPSGLCAERVALFAANAQWPGSPIRCLAISARNPNGRVSEPVKPCGACLQAILESEQRFGKPIRLILDSARTLFLIDGVKNLLPLSFGKDDLAG